MCSVSFTALPDREAMVYIERVQTEWPLRIQLPIGTRVPFHCTASGKMYLSTLERRYRSGDARGNVRAKTGYISGARTLSGYVEAESGHMIAFSLMCNHYSVRTSRVNRAQDQIVEMLADFQGR